MSSSTSFQARDQYTPTLTCEFCRRRKIKCDKLSPCSNCQKAGVHCEPVRRKRLPRGRHTSRLGGSTDDLRDKIDRLEALVNVALAESSSDSRGAAGKREGRNRGSNGNGNGNINGAAFSTENVNSSPGEGHALAARSPASSGTTSEGRSMAPQFWSNMIKEIHGIQGLASEDTEEDDDDDHAEEQATPYFSSPSYIMGLSLGRLGHLHSLSLRPSREVAAALCDVYLNQVDRIIKVLHRPSVKQHLLHGHPYPGCRDSPTAENALDAAIFYAAVASMTDRQCQLLFHCDRMDVLPEYQSACETGLERADLMRTTDMTVLQAFVLYLVCLQDKKQLLNMAYFQLIDIGCYQGS